MLGTKISPILTKKVFFSRISLILTAFHEFLLFFIVHRNFAVSAQIWAEAQRKRQICDAHAQNYGEWWKIGQIREKLSKSKKFVKKTPFLGQTRRNLSPQQSNKLKNLKNFTNLRKSQKISKISNNLKKSQKISKISENLKKSQKS